MTEYDPRRAEHGRHELPPDEPVRPIGDLQPGGVAGVVRRGRSQLAVRRAGRRCCACCSASRSSPRSARPSPATRWRRPGPPTCWCCSIRCSSAKPRSTPRSPTCSARSTSLQASGSNDQAAIENAQARLAALSILIGTVAATGPGVTLTIDDTAPGVSPETMLDVINELRAAGAEAMRGPGQRATSESRCGWASTPGWSASPGALVVDGITLNPPYSVLAIGDPATLAAAMNIPGGAVDSVERVGGTMSVQQADVVDVTALRQPKPRQYAQPVK